MLARKARLAHSVARLAFFGQDCFSGGLRAPVVKKSRILRLRLMAGRGISGLYGGGTLQGCPIVGLLHGTAEGMTLVDYEGVSKFNNEVEL